jgi:isoleucyl-tRNA synthetase
MNSKKRKNCTLVLNIILECLIKWFAPILSFTTEEIFSLICKNEKSIHLKKFVKIPRKWNNQKLIEKWITLKKIRDYCNISIEEKRTEKMIGSSLEARIKIKLKNKFFEVAKDIDFAELCITSEAELVKDEKITEDIEVETFKAEGNKCNICWKIKQKKCERSNCAI